MFLARAPREGLIFFLMRGAWIATLPRLNCRGNFVEASGSGRSVLCEVSCLGLTAEATSLRLGEDTAGEDAFRGGLGLTAEATSLRL